MSKTEGWRRDVTVTGVPYRWDTNLSDSEIRDLYRKIQREPALAAEMLLGDSDSEGISVAWLEVPFLDGLCWCVGSFGHFHATYRTYLGWEIEEARKCELEELRKAQEEERRIQIILFHAQDAYYFDQMIEAFETKDYARAEYLLRLRAANRQDSEQKEVQELFYYFIQNGGLERFLSFPTLGPALRFLEDFDVPWFRYTFLANRILAKIYDYTEDERINMCDQVFDRACKRYPDNQFLFKDACLIFQRHGALSYAIKFCKMAVQLGLHDDTKTGFKGRLARLERQQDRR